MEPKVKLAKAGDFVEIAKSSIFKKFTLMEDGQIEVSEYFGYDFLRSHTHSKISAREHWKQYIREGHVITSYKIGDKSWHE